MSLWFRCYADLVDDPKVQRLPDALFRALINLWCLACANAGVLPSIGDIAFKLRMTEARARAALDGLRAAGLIDDTEAGSRPHNWDRRQFRSDVSNDRVKRHRERHRSGDVTLQAPLPQRPQNTETETERKKDAPPLRSAAPGDDPEREYFARGKALLGDNSGGLLKKVLVAKGSNFALARAALEMASTKGNMREYLGAIAKSREHEGGADQLRISGDAW